MKHIVVLDQNAALVTFAGLLNDKYCCRTAQILTRDDHKKLAAIDNSDAIYLVWQADVDGIGGSQVQDFIQRFAGLLKLTPKVFLTACHIYNPPPSFTEARCGPAAVAGFLRDLAPVATIMVTPGPLIFSPGSEMRVILSENYLVKRGLDHKTMWVRDGVL
jgi:hypothetical protein